MAKGYRPVLRDQPFLLAPDMREWLPAGHAVWLVIRVVEEHLDTSALHAWRKRGGAGAAGYDPVMLLTLLVWAYAQGVTSSRRIEAACWSDVAFRVICAGDVPDHVTVARFRQRFPQLAEDMFAGVLALCARLGMGQVGTVALDGTKVAADASKEANRTGEHLRKLAAERAAAHAAADAAGDELYGDGCGDEVPAAAADPRTRDERIAAALADLDAERARLAAGAEARAQAHREAAAAGTPVPGRPAEAVAAEVARMRLDQARAAYQAKVAGWERRNAAAAAAGRGGVPGPRPVPPGQYYRVRDAAARLEAAQARAAGARKSTARAGQAAQPVRNITDPDSRLMPVRGGGFIQGYNAQNVVSEDGLIIATRLVNDPTDYGWYQPMISDAVAAAAMMAAHRPAAAHDTAQPRSGPAPGQIELVLADAGYCSQASLTCGGPDRLIATGKRHDLEKAARAAAVADASSDGGTDGTALAAMTARLATSAGIAAYRRRGHIAETPHGQIKHNMGLRRLTMRGKTKAAAEWVFITAAANLLKAMTTGHLTAAALNALAS